MTTKNHHKIGFAIGVLEALLHYHDLTERQKKSIQKVIDGLNSIEL